MAGFKARKMKKGFFEILGLEDFIEQKISELKRSLHAPTPVSGKKATKAAKATKRAPMKAAAKKTMAPTGLDRLVAVLERHPRRAELVRAGKEKDQLLRSLVPLYLARSESFEVTSGMISKFWAMHGVKYAAPNAAKALREHVGYARATKNGRQITPNGVKYVEAAMQRRAA